MFRVAFALVLVISFSPLNADEIRVGLLPDGPYDEETEFAFYYCTANELLFPSKAYIFAEDGFESLSAICNLTADGIAGVFDSTTKANSDIVESVCDIMDIPHIIMRWTDDDLSETSMINLYPHPSALGQAYLDLVMAFGWKHFTVLYEDYEGLSRISNLVKLNSEMSRYSVTIQRLYTTEKGGYRKVFKEIWKSGKTHFVLDCNIDNLGVIFKHAQQVGLMTNIHKYLVINLDMHTIDLDPFKYSETNITGIRMLNPRDPRIEDFWIKIHQDRNETTSDSLQLKTALMADAVTLYSSVIKKFSHIREEGLSCEENGSWGHGSTVINEMRMASIEGLTGLVNFNTAGVRTDISLEIVELTEQGISKVGNWNTKKGITFTRTFAHKQKPGPNTLFNATLTVIIALTDPYAMVKITKESLKGNDRYEGFGIDLIDELAKLTGFSYNFIVRDDKLNGVQDKITKEWSGMIGDVRNDKAQLAITDLTITAAREKAVDFTVPFMTLGISILYKKPSKSPPNFFSFAQPFALEVWLCLAAAYFLVSVSLFIMGRLCPSEWTNPYPCIEEPEFLLNQFSLRNSFWFTIGSLMQQGSEIAPIAYSTRMVAGAWWFFTLIMVSSYTANLAAFLATEDPDIAFNNVKELVDSAEKSGITYGAKKNGATADFFKNSDSELFNKIYRYMEENDETVMVPENKDGVVKAEEENYAFFMESTSIEYEIQRHCNLTQRGGLLDEKGYGIAMKKGSPYRNELNTALLKLQSSGKLQELKRKWWEEKRGGGQCVGEADSQEAKPLNLKNVGGVFWVTVIGIVVAIALVFFEMVLHIMKSSIKYKTSFIEELKQELKFYFRFKGLVKTVNVRRSNSESPEEIDEDKIPQPIPDIAQTRKS